MNAWHFVIAGMALGYLCNTRTAVAVLVVVAAVTLGVNYA